MTGQALIVQGDALHLPLPDASVDLVVTSPPYAFLRAYDTGYPHLEVGAEATPAEFLEHLWQATAEMVRVLKPTGSIFVDLGDKYAGGGGFAPDAPSNVARRSNATHDDGAFRVVPSLRDRLKPGPVKAAGIPNKSLMLLPERYRIGCVDQTSPYHRAEFYQQLANDLIDGDITPERGRQLAAEFEASPKSKGLGLIARAVIVWDKPNSLPESVTDRPRRSHEDWVHLTKQPRYYSAIDEVREPHDHKRDPKTMEGTRGGYGRDYRVDPNGLTRPTFAVQGRDYNPLGKLPGSVWTIPSEPLRLPNHLGVQHYAAFPSEWPRRLILGWSPPGICLDCGQGRVPVVERDYIPQGDHDPTAGKERYARQEQGHGDNIMGRFKPQEMPHGRANMSATILGYACACTPHTNHPGSGERTGGGGDPLTAYGNKAHWGKPTAKLEDRPRCGPWREYHLDGWKPPPTRPAVVLDPFSGTGTTPMVAQALGRIGVGVDLSMPYCRAARWRVKHDAGKAISRTWTERQGSLL